MASLVLKMSVSLDGYVASADGSNDWLAAGRSDDSTSWVVETVSNAGAHLMVFSNSLTSADWAGTEIAAGDLAEAITRLKQERSGGYLLAQGGARFARSRRTREIATTRSARLSRIRSETCVR